MTLKEKIITYLDSKAMFPEDAVAVFESVKSHPANDCLRDRWNHDANEYPEALTNGLLNFTDKIALEWIDANCPQAWFRPMFTA